MKKNTNAIVMKSIVLRLMLALMLSLEKNTMAGKNEMKTKISEITKKIINPALLFAVLRLIMNNNGIVIVIPENKEKNEIIIFSFKNFLFIIFFPSL